MAGQIDCDGDDRYRGGERKPDPRHVSGVPQQPPGQEEGHAGGADDGNVTQHEVEIERVRIHRELLLNE